MFTGNRRKSDGELSLGGRFLATRGGAMFFPTPWQPGASTRHMTSRGPISVQLAPKASRVDLTLDFFDSIIACLSV